MELSIRPVLGIGEVRPGDDLAELISAAAPWLADGDVLVVTSKIISKAEGRLVEVPPDGPGYLAARDALLTQESTRTVAQRGATRIVQTHHGFVMASAGIDASNVDKGRLVLLPVDPDASARALRAGLRERGLDVAVLVSDTMGRPWRTGLTDVALGAAGIAAVRDYRGDLDAHGNELQLTEMAVIDELCAAAELVKGKYDQVPVSVVRGLAVTGAEDGPGAAVLVRAPEQDLFALGTAEARALGRQDAATLPETSAFDHTPVDPALVRRALAQLDAPGLHLVEGGARDKLAERVPGAVEVIALAGVPEPPAAARVGADAQRLRAALAATGLASGWLTVDQAYLAELVPLPAGEVPLGALAIGYPIISS